MARKECSIEGCDRGVLARGLCLPHYQRLKRYGDPTAGGPMKTPYGKSLAYFNEVVLPYSGTDCLIWPFLTDTGGYGRLRYEGRDQVVSRLVCEKTHGKPPTPDHEAAHSCGNGHLACVASGHLSWKTHIDNHADRAEHGTNNAGETCGAAKLTAEQITAIRNSAAIGATPASLSRRYGVNESNIRKIVKRESWRHI